MTRLNGSIGLFVFVEPTGDRKHCHVLKRESIHSFLKYVAKFLSSALVLHRPIAIVQVVLYSSSVLAKCM
jgi:hypothetical protein